MESKEENIKKTSLNEKVKILLKKQESEKKVEVLSFNQYLDKLCKDARPARTSFQRIYDMIIDAGTEEVKDLHGKIKLFNFFKNLDADGNYTKDSIFGLEGSIKKLVERLRNGAYELGGEKRLLLLEGPVGSAKSTIASLFKRGLEKDTLKNPIYSLRWKELGDFPPTADNIKVEGITLFNQSCQLHEEPLKLLDPRIRKAVLDQIKNENKGKEMKYLNKGYFDLIQSAKGLCPHCQFNYDKLMEYYKGDWEKVMEHVDIYRFYFSEAGRVGIATFTPKDEKNQDSTELTGNIDFRKIAHVGADSDPRALNFDGEFQAANRGMIEVIEILKLEIAFLYDFLSATQEKNIKPKKQAQTAIDELILAHTNEPELRKLEENEKMEAFRDRTKRVQIPYNLKLSDEIKIYEKDYSQERLGNFKHIAPHSIEIAAMFAVLSRLDEPKEQTVTLMQKLELYNGKSTGDLGEDVIRKMKKDGQREGLFGISPRFIQDILADTLAGDDNPKCVNVFMILNKIREQLQSSILINKEETKIKYETLLGMVQEEFDSIIKEEIQKAIAADEGDVKELFNNYISNVKAYVNGNTIRDKFTNRDMPPDEKIMRGIEIKIGVSENGKDAYRKEIMNYIGSKAIEGEKFDYTSKPELHKALIQKLFEGKKDSINFKKSLSEDLADNEEQEKIDIIKSRLIKDYNYCDGCANDMLKYAASIFARGDSVEPEE